jgi:hypothetical protein
LHVLSTPPAFVLSQNQTLRECFMIAAVGEPTTEYRHRKATEVAI